MTEDIDNMDPDASPSADAGVRRVNNIPMYILGGVLIAFLVMMGIVAADRAAKQNNDANEQHLKTGNTSMFAKEIAGDQMDGLIKPLTPPAEAMPKPEPVLIARPENPNEPPMPPSAPSTPHDDEADRFRQAKLQMFQEAVKAKTGVQVVAPQSAGSSPTSTPKTREEMLARMAAVRQQISAVQHDDPTAAYQKRLAYIRSMGIGGETPSNSSAPSLLQVANSDNAQTTGNSGNSYSQFAGGDGDRWKLESETAPPRSPYELRAGFVVPATLISGINSDLPGQIMAQVAQNVYDTPIGKYLLIPQGSRLVGTYSSDVAYGQARVLVAWQRIVFPDGKALDIGAMPGADSAGYAGFNDLENHHYVRLFSSALLMSAVTAATTYSQRQNQAGSVFGRPDAGSALSEALGQQLGQVTAQLIAKNMNIAPTLEIRPGYRFNVIVTKDMTFTKPYQSFDY